MSTKQEQTLERRQQLIEELAGLAVARREEAPAQGKALAAAKAQVDEARRKLDAAMRAYGEVNFEAKSAALAFDRRRDAIQAELRSSAPPAIREFIRELQRMRDPELERHDPARAAAIKEAMQAAEALEFEALSLDETEERLDALRAALAEERAGRPAVGAL